MTAAVVRHAYDDQSAEPQMKGPLTASVTFHIIVIFLCIVGIPYFHHPLPITDEPMSVELATPDELAHTNKPPPKAPLQQQKPMEKPKPMPPQPPKVTAQAPPKPVAPEKPQEPVKDAAPPKPDELAPPKKVIKKPPPPKPVEKKPDPPKTPEKAKEQDADFQSVLKNLIATPQAASGNPDSTETKPTPAQPLPLAMQMTMSELDALRRQLSECWQLMAGARYAEDLVVDVHMVVNVDRTLRDAQIADQLRYSTDSYFRAAADSALRAVRNPHCNPLNLPPNKYEFWKDITVTFDPREML